MRARLIMRFLISVRQLDRDAQRLEQDLDFREPLPTPSGQPIRRELAGVLIPCQIEPDQNTRIDPGSGGLALEQRMTFNVLRRDLLRLGLIDEGLSGTALLGLDDRVEALFTKRNDLIQEFPDPPGMYITRVVPRGFGISIRSPKADLISLVCEERKLMPRRVAS